MNVLNVFHVMNMINQKNCLIKKKNYQIQGLKLSAYAHLDTETNKSSIQQNGKQKLPFRNRYLKSFFMSQALQDQTTHYKNKNTVKCKHDDCSIIQHRYKQKFVSFVCIKPWFGREVHHVEICGFLCDLWGKWDYLSLSRFKTILSNTLSHAE